MDDGKKEVQKLSSLRIQVLSDKQVERALLCAFGIRLADKAKGMPRGQLATLGWTKRESKKEWSMI